jgi:PAS domain S-box-containing protein
MSYLFDFSFDNPVSFLLAFIPALFNLALLFHILVFLPRTHFTNIFALLTFAAFFWQINDSLHRVIVSAHAADVWDCILCTAWLFIGPLCLHFSMMYAQVIKSHSSRLYVSLLYVPSFVFLAIYQMHYYEHVFDHVSFWGWVNPHNKNIIDIIQVYWISALVISAVILLFTHTFRIRNNESLKRQSFLITAGIAIPALAGIVTEVVLPTVFGLAPVPLTSTFMSCFSVATVVALKKYKLFGAPELITSEALIDFIPIMVASVSTTGRITHINRAWSEILDSKNKDFIGLHINDVFRPESPEEANDLNNAVARAVRKNQVQQTESTIITPKGKIDIVSTLTPIKNNNKVEGVLFTSRILTGSKNEYGAKTKEPVLSAGR